MKTYNVWVEDHEPVCGNCKHFYQHYIRNNIGFFEAFSGHCVYPRNKFRRPNDSCGYFNRKEI